LRRFRNCIVEKVYIEGVVLSILLGMSPTCRRTNVRSVSSLEEHLDRVVDREWVLVAEETEQLNAELLRQTHDTEEKPKFPGPQIFGAAVDLNRIDFNAGGV